MATFKYFNGTTQLSNVGPLDNKQFWAMFGFPRRGVSYDGFTKWVGTADGRVQPVTRIIEYKKNPSLHKCDARCQNAKGHNCECSCGGQFHGAGMGASLSSVLK